MCPIPDCSVEFGFTVGGEHFSNVHGSMVFTSSSLWVSWTIKSPDIIAEESIVVNHDGRTFILQNVKATGAGKKGKKRGVVVWILGTKVDASRYQFSLDTRRSRLQPGLSYKGPVLSATQFTLDQVLEERRSFIVGDDLLQHYLDPDTKQEVVTFNFEIKRSPEVPGAATYT